MFINVFFRKTFKKTFSESFFFHLSQNLQPGHQKATHKPSYGAAVHADA
jgi:hypothetical protein